MSLPAPPTLPVIPGGSASAQTNNAMSPNSQDDLSASANGGGGMSMMTTRPRKGRSKDAGLVRKLTVETYWTTHEVEMMLQEMADITGDEPLDRSHMEMWFTQHGLTPKLIDLIVKSLAPAELIQQQQQSSSSSGASSTATTTSGLPTTTTTTTTITTHQGDKEKEQELAAACIQALSILEKGTNDQRMYFFFRLFDLNGDGMLSISELQVFEDVMLEHFEKVSGRRPDERALTAIQALMKEVVSEVEGNKKQKTEVTLDTSTPTGTMITTSTASEEDGIKLEDLLHHHKLIKLWELLKILDSR